MTPGKQPATVTNIPDDILSINIFIRLPSKQLAQMRSLSKPWNALLSSPSFIKSHLDCSARNNDEILLVFEGGRSFKDIKAFTPHPTDRTPQLMTDFVKRLLVKPLCEDGGCNIIGSVNGLICLTYGYYYYEAIYIWNPSLSALLRLPPYSMPSSCAYDVYFQFGFDPKTDDYKVVKLTADIPLATGKYMLRKDKRWKQVEVYSMRKHSWEFIRSFPSRCTDVIDRKEVCVDGHDGHLHWLAYDVEEGVELIHRQKIVAFDLGAETFNLISLPDSIQIYKYNRFNVLDFMSGKLCVMSQVKDSEYEVWVMDEYGVAESWVKLRVFSHHCGIHRPLGFTLNNELVYIDNDECIALYDPIASKVNSFKIKVSMHHRNKIVQYVDSLVWVVAAKHCIRKKPRRPKKGYRTWFT